MDYVTMVMCIQISVDCQHISVGQPSCKYLWRIWEKIYDAEWVGNHHPYDYIITSHFKVNPLFAYYYSMTWASKYNSEMLRIMSPNVVVCASHCYIMRGHGTRVEHWVMLCVLWPMTLITKWPFMVNKVTPKWHACTPCQFKTSSNPRTSLH